MENFLRDEDIQNMLYGLYLERHKLTLKQKRATLLILQTGVFGCIIMDQLCPNSPVLKTSVHVWTGPELMQNSVDVQVWSR